MIFFYAIKVNMKRRLEKEFFMRKTTDVAKDVLGKFLMRRLENGKILEGKIVETEAYIGPEDRASHAFVPRRERKSGVQKITIRNRAEFMEGGHIYIYLVYGMYWQLNITTGPTNYPECFLIRAVEVVGDSGAGRGPGKLCKYFKLDKSFYGFSVVGSPKLWLEDRGVKIPKRDIIATPRVGIDYAGPYWAGRKLRFYIKNNQAVSGPPVGPPRSRSAVSEARPKGGSKLFPKK